MIKKAFLLIINISIFLCLYCQNISIEERDLIDRFINNVKQSNKKEVAKLVSYPFIMVKPIPALKNEEEFVKYYDIIFDSTLVNIITTTLPIDESYIPGAQGIDLFSNYNTPIYIKLVYPYFKIDYISEEVLMLKNKYIELEKSKLHESIKEYQEPILCDSTKSFLIRVDFLSVDEQIVRLCLWSKNKSISTKPDIVLEGYCSYEGSGGFMNCYFKNNNTQYSVSDMGIFIEEINKEEIYEEFLGDNNKYDKY